MALVFRFVIVADWSRISGMYDVTCYFGPQAFFMDYAVHHGELPLWNPLTLCGTPYAANPQTALFYPLNLLRSGLAFTNRPSHTLLSLVLYAAFHMVIAGAGAYAFARDHGLSRSASFVAAFGYAFSASMVRRVCAFQFLPTVAWMPLCLLCMRRALRARALRSEVRYAVLGGLVLGLSTLGGFLQATPYMAVTLGVYCVAHRVLHPKVEGRQLRALLGGDLLAVVLVGTMGALVAGAMLIPAAELAGAGLRLKESEAAAGQLAQSAPLSTLWKWLVMYPGSGEIRHNIRGAGAGVLVLAAAGMTHRRWRDVAAQVVVLLALCDCCLGPPFPLATLVKWLTPFQLIESSRAFILACLPLAMLAAFGVDAAATRLGSWRWRSVRSVAYAAAGLCVLIPLWRWAPSHPFLDVPMWVVYVPATVLAVVLLAGWVPPAPLWRVGAAALVLAEIVLWNQVYVPHLITGPARYLPSLTAYSDTPSPWTDNRRGADMRPNLNLFSLKAGMTGYDPLYIARARHVVCRPGREGRYGRIIMQTDVFQENYRGHSFLKRPFWLARQYVAGELPGKADLFPATTTVFLVNPGDLPAPEVSRAEVTRSSVSERSKETALSRARSFKARAGPGRSRFRARLGTVESFEGHSAVRIHYTSTCSGRIESQFRGGDPPVTELGRSVRIVTTAEGSEGVIELPLPDFRPLDITATLELFGTTGVVRFTQVQLAADLADEDHLIHILRRGANGVSIEVGDLPSHRILAFIDADYPGWRAYVDGERVPILRANDAFKAVVLPPGVHHVEFVFSPASVYAGVGVSATAIFGCAALLFLTRRRKERAAAM